MPLTREQLQQQTDEHVKKLPKADQDALEKARRTPSPILVRVVGNSNSSSTNKAMAAIVISERVAPPAKKDPN